MFNLTVLKGKKYISEDFVFIDKCLDILPHEIITHFLAFQLS